MAQPKLLQFGFRDQKFQGLSGRMLGAVMKALGLYKRSCLPWPRVGFDLGVSQDVLHAVSAKNPYDLFTISINISLGVTRVPKVFSFSCLKDVHESCQTTQMISSG